jgi:dienelactone hydrolase
MTAVVEGATETIRLWPDGPPTGIDGVPDEVEYPVRAGVAVGTTFLRNISDPTLTVFTPTEASNGVGVIVVPGGGWTINAWSHEGLDVARWLAGLPRPKAQKPGAIGDVISTPEYLAAREACADDGRRAIELVREHAERFGVVADTVGMIGFSAGAFLAVDIALDPRAEQLAFIAPIYGGETRGAPVPPDAPPMFTAVAQDDLLVRIVEGVHAEWSAADRPSELHVFARGGHGFGMVRQGLPADGWTDLFLAWLDDLAGSA